MKNHLKFIFSLQLLFVFTLSYSQQDSLNTDTLVSKTQQSIQYKSDSLFQTDSTLLDSLNRKNNISDSLAGKRKKRVRKPKVKRPDSLRVKIKPALQLYLDYGKVATFFADFEQKMEFGIGFQFTNRLQPNFRYGIGSIEPGGAIDNGTYNAEGNYWRVGINYLVPLDGINSLFIGVKYGESQFEDGGSYEIASEIWDTFQDDFSRSGFSANWFSLIIGSEKRVMNERLILGGSTGVRRLIQSDKTKVTDEASFIDIYTIPGYGLTINKTTPFLNLYIKYQISF